MNKLKGLESELIKDFQDNSEQESDGSVESNIDDQSESDEEEKEIRDHNDKVFK